MAMSAEEFVRTNSDKISLRSSTQRCGCGAVIEEHPDEQYMALGKAVCSDCYFLAFGEEIERHPIYNPTRIATQ